MNFVYKIDYLYLNDFFFLSIGNDFLSSFETRLIEALTLCAKNTFEMIKNRANPTL